MSAQPTLLNTSQMTSTRQMRALHRERRKAELEKMRKPVPRKERPEFVNNEMGLIGESRSYQHLRLSQCRECDGYTQILEVRYPHGKDVAEYRVRCAIISCCKESTPWLPSSQAAIQHWKVTAALSR